MTRPERVRTTSAVDKKLKGVTLKLKIIMLTERQHSALNAVDTIVILQGNAVLLGHNMCILPTISLKMWLFELYSIRD